MKKTEKKPKQKKPPPEEVNNKIKELSIKVNSTFDDKKINLKIFKENKLFKNLKFKYPNSIWKKYNKFNKRRLVDNLSYIFTSHLPFLYNQPMKIIYNTALPETFSYAQYFFLRYLPAYAYLNKNIIEKDYLKILFNTNYEFNFLNDKATYFPKTKNNRVIILFTFGKDSFLTYHLAKELGLDPILIWFNDPIDEGYEAIHKLKLFDSFLKKHKEKAYIIDNDFSVLREKGDGWFGWEMAITSWVLFSLPFSYYFKAKYILVSNEKSNNDYLFDKNGYKVIPDWEQSLIATKELSLLIQSLSENEVFVFTFLQGLNDLAIIGILKERYYDETFKHLMSCWSEQHTGGENSRLKRWCGHCTKCARIYVYLLANGINPHKEAGFEDNMLENSKEKFYNVFGQKAKGTGWDSYGLNVYEQALAFYLSYLRGYDYPLIRKFRETLLFDYVEKNFNRLVEEYYGNFEDYLIPKIWKKKVRKIFKTTLDKVKKEIYELKFAK